MANYKQITATPGTSFETVLPANTKRRKLIIFNTGDNDVLFGLSEAGGITIAAGSHIAFLDSAPLNAIVAAGVDDPGSLVIWEG